MDRSGTGNLERSGTLTRSFQVDVPNCFSFRTFPPCARENRRLSTTLKLPSKQSLALSDFNIRSPSGKTGRPRRKFAESAKSAESEVWSDQSSESG